MKMIYMDPKAFLTDRKLLLAFLSIMLATSGDFKDILLPYVSIAQHWTLAKISSGGT
jgi:hypothetical protein